MPWNLTPDLHVLPVRAGDAIRVRAPFALADFVPAATYGLGVVRVDPTVTANGTPFTFNMPQTAILSDPIFPDIFVASTLAVHSYTYDPGDGHFFGSQTITANLVKINKATGATVSTIGLMSTGMNAGLAYDEVAGVIWGATWVTDTLYSINPSTAVATLVGTLTESGSPITGPYNITLDPVTGKLYLIETTGKLYIVNKSDATCQLIADTGIPAASRGLAFDTRRRVLWMSDYTSPDNLYTVDPDTGFATLVGPISSDDFISCLVYDSDDDKLFYFDMSPTAKLFRFDFSPSTAEWNIAAYDSTYLIDGNPNFIDNGGVPTLILDATVLPVEGETYIIGVFRVSDGRTLDFSIVHRDKANLDVFDTTSDQVDMDMLERVLALAGHNTKYRLLNILAGQPSEHEVAMFNPGIVDLSINADDLNDDFGLAEKLKFTTEIDSNGDTIRETGGE